MNDAPRIAVLGSCITRDLWPVRGDAAGLCYISRTSLPSLFAPPVAGFVADVEPPNGLKPHPHRALIADIAKTGLARLVAFRPTHLILDLIDERFDLLAASGSLVTRSWELCASGYLKQPALAGPVAPRLSAGCDLLWRQALRQFAEFIEATPLREAKLILHAAHWADIQRDADGRERPLRDPEILPGQAADIGAYNRLMARYQGWVREALPTASLVQAPEQAIADADHRWGLSPFHYIAAYHDEIWRQLESLGLRRPD